MGKPSRRFIFRSKIKCQVPEEKKMSEYTVSCFNDLILVAKQKNEKKYKYIYHMPLLYTTGLETSENNQDILILNNDEEFCILSFEDLEVYSNWRGELESILEDLFTNAQIRNPKLEERPSSTSSPLRRRLDSPDIKKSRKVATLDFKKSRKQKKKKGTTPRMNNRRSEDELVPSRRKGSKSGRRRRKTAQNTFFEKNVN